MGECSSEGQKDSPAKSEMIDMIKFISALVAVVLVLASCVRISNWVKEVNEESVSRRIADAAAEARKYPEERVKDLESQSKDATRDYNQLFQQKLKLERENRKLKKELELDKAIIRGPTPAGPA